MTESSVRATVSFELFPPRTERGRLALPAVVRRLADARPEFFSVTYGAAGSTREGSRAVVREVMTSTGVPAVAHVTCAGATRAATAELVRELLDAGVGGLLALRGDRPQGLDAGAVDELPRASDLVQLIREVEADRPGPRVRIGVAATPTSSAGCAGDATTGPCGEMKALLAKQEAGADLALTQVFFDPADYERYVALARAVGVTIPIVPGVAPLDDLARLERLERVSGVPVPAELLARLAATPVEQRSEVGAALGAALLRRVLDAGAPGVHVYTFNQAGPALALLAAAGLRP